MSSSRTTSLSAQRRQSCVAKVDLPDPDRPSISTVVAEDAHRPRTTSSSADEAPSGWARPEFACIRGLYGSGDTPQASHAVIS
jgi:hypothetical protein